MGLFMICRRDYKQESESENHSAPKKGATDKAHPL